MKSNGNTVISLDDVLKAVAPDGLDGKLPPVHQWQPKRCSDIGMEIHKDGSWWHDGGRINRPRMVRLFSRILRKDEDGETYLVTPYEKVIVHIEDAPFLAVRVDRVAEPGQGQALAFTSNVGDVCVAGPGTPLRVETDPQTGEPAPYIRVRDDLDAKLTRAVFYDLANLAETAPDDSNMLGVWSRGVFFPIGAAG